MVVFLQTRMPLSELGDKMGEKWKRGKDVWEE